MGLIGSQPTINRATAVRKIVRILEGTTPIVMTVMETMKSNKFIINSYYICLNRSNSFYPPEAWHVLSWRAWDRALRQSHMTLITFIKSLNHSILLPSSCLTSVQTTIHVVIDFHFPWSLSALLQTCPCLSLPRSRFRIDIFNRSCTCSPFSRRDPWTAMEHTDLRICIHWHRSYL